ncbi:hypothetical protein BHM03_00036913 [Ensete ventricosum]|nr:hypothetical protein BHM03_00036913 [Ensete ventricosum]
MEENPRKSVRGGVCGLQHPMRQGRGVSYDSYNEGAGNSPLSTTFDASASSIEASFYIFPTLSIADNGFYTCSPASSLLQPLLTSHSQHHRSVLSAESTIQGPLPMNNSPAKPQMPLTLSLFACYLSNIALLFCR